MDSNDLEREKGITILAKNTSVEWDGVTLNIVDTPGHADFGGEVERALTMVDGIMLLVDAAEGPLPQTRFVLRKALGARPARDPRDQQDRPARRPHRRGRRRGLRAVHGPRRRRPPARLPDRVLLRSRRLGVARPRRRRAPTWRRCATSCSRRSRRPTYTEGAPLQAWVTNLDANPYLGRLALCRVIEGTIRKGQQVAWCRIDGSIQRAKVVELYLTRQLTRVPVDEAGPGDLVAVAGIAEITIGETLADPDDPRPLPVITVDEPALSMTIGINTSPLAGRDGTKMTARLVKNRLDAELVGNVSIRVNPTDRPDAWEVQARGELQLAVLVETMRREGFELTVGKPEVVTRDDRRPALRAGRAGHDRHPRRPPRRGHAAARAPQGADGEHGQPRPRLGAPRVPRAGARPDRLPHRVPDRDPRHGRAQPHLRGLRAVVRRHPAARARLARRRPHRAGDDLRDDSTCRTGRR